jgi:putative transposon-encoded protein
MKHIPLGRTGIEVSEICLGTMTWGSQNTEAEGHAQMDHALARGVNFWDAAEMYPVNPVKAETVGRTEEIIGTWFAKGGRDRVVLATKGKAKGKPTPDSALRDTENVPLSETVEAYFEREVKPHAPDAWIDHEKTKVGYEIPFNRHFYVFAPPRPLAEIDAELKVVTDRIVKMIGELSQ